MAAKRELEIRELLAREGVTNVTVALNNKAHYKIVGAHGDKVIVVFTPGTPSDQRNDLNLRAKIRRKIREAV